MSLPLQKAFRVVVGILSLTSALAAAPQLTIRMYAVAPVSQDLVGLAAPEAARILRSLPMRLGWVNCSAPARPDSCESPDLPTDISIRLVPKALPSANKSALGMAMWSESGSSAAIFYDRALSIRKPGLLLTQILGRAMAHEVVHLLLGTTSHAEVGLMKAEWIAEDLLCLQINLNYAARRGSEKRTTRH
jgi:hypothetical protein